MLHTKLLDNQSTGSKEDFNGFNIYRRGSHLGHVTQMPRTNYRSPTTVYRGVTGGNTSDLK